VGQRGAATPPPIDRFFLKKGQFLKKKIVFLGKKWDFAPPENFFSLCLPLKSLGTPLS